MIVLTEKVFDFSINNCLLSFASIVSDSKLRFFFALILLDFSILS